MFQIMRQILGMSQIYIFSFKKKDNNPVLIVGIMLNCRIEDMTVKMIYSVYLQISSF